VRADARPALGAYFGNLLPDEASIQEFETRIATRCSIVSYYWAWGLGRADAPIAFARDLVQSGRVPLLTWEPWRLPKPGCDPAVDFQFSLRRILSGEFDAYVSWFADRLATVPGRILLRPMHEMNGNWYPWCGTTNENHPAQFVGAWRRLRRIFEQRRVRNVDWVWCPYAVSVPLSSENEIPRYFPGEDDVDVVAIDGYNWGDSRPWSRWQTFDEVFASGYRTLRSLSTKPVIIAEVGCAETGGDKAGWLRDVRMVARDYAGVRAVVWFNVNKECDWRIDSSAEIRKAFQSGWESESHASVSADVSAFSP
jgi:hypothetical protein